MSSASAIAGQTFSQVKTSPLVTLKASLRAAVGLARPGDGARQQIDVDRLRHPRRAAGIIERAALLAQHRGIDAERRDQIHRAAHGFADDQDGAQDAPVPGLALLQLAQKILLRPIEVRLLVHFRAAFARRHGERADVDAIGLGALQQRDMPERPARPARAPPSDCAASDRWFVSGSDRASRRPGSALHRARRRRDGLRPAARLRRARIAPASVRSIGTWRAP